MGCKESNQTNKQNIHTINERTYIVNLVLEHRFFFKIFWYMSIVYLQYTKVTPAIDTGVTNNMSRMKVLSICSRYPCVSVQACFGVKFCGVSILETSSLLSGNNMFSYENGLFLHILPLCNTAIGRCGRLLQNNLYKYMY